jgi:metacaspase-1
MNKALLVGINEYPSQPLKGCVNDIADMANFLVSKCNFKMDEIRMLVDLRATKINIIERLNWLVSGLKPGDRILFHYSGHGVQIPTRNPHGEVDGLDEAICPVDFDWTEEHMIIDKEFNKLFSTIPEGVKFLWISDSCHSGDLQKDLPDHYIVEKTIAPPVDIDWRLQTAKQKNIALTEFATVSNELNLALISGCKSKQTSADSVFNKKCNGALTYFLLDELNKEDGLSIPLTKLVRNVNTALQKNKFEQDPQLEGNDKLKKKPFLG